MRKWKGRHIAFHDRDRHSIYAGCTLYLFRLYIILFRLYIIFMKAVNYIYAGCTLYLCRLYIIFMPAVNYIYAGCKLYLCRLYIIFMKAVIYIYAGCTLYLWRLYIIFMKAVIYIYAGCTLYLRVHVTSRQQHSVYLLYFYWCWGCVCAVQSNCLHQHWQSDNCIDTVHQSNNYRKCRVCRQQRNCAMQVQGWFWQKAGAI